jgi:hypothetical protein
MRHFTREKRLASLVSMLMACSFVGCGGTNLTGYRPANEHAATEPLETAKQAVIVPESESQTEPLEAELASDDRADEFELLPASALVPVNVVSSVRALMSIPAGDQQPGEISTGSGLQSSKPTAEPAVAKGSNQIEILIKDKKFQTEPKTGALRVSFDDLDLLKVCNMEPVVENAVDFMPDWLKGLNEKTVRVRGFMYPTYETEGIERFVLARDNQICCFGRDPKVYDLVQIDMKPGKTTNYIPATRAFDVVGTLKIQMLSQGGKPYGLYLIDQAIVIDR